MPNISFDKEWLQFKKKACLILYTDFITFLMICILSYNTIDFNFNKTILSCLGIILFLIGVFIKFNAYTVIGDKGWYWYNSFASINKINYEQKGVYRYLENPMYGLGYLALIGISFVFRSFPGLFIALFDWIIIHAFYYLFEKD